jgi:hypothetical protein
MVYYKIGPKRYLCKYKYVLFGNLLTRINVKTKKVYFLPIFWLWFQVHIVIADPDREKPCQCGSRRICFRIQLTWWINMVQKRQKFVRV